MGKVLRGEGNWSGRREESGDIRRILKRTK